MAEENRVERNNGLETTSAEDIGVVTHQPAPAPESVCVNITEPPADQSSPNQQHSKLPDENTTEDQVDEKTPLLQGSQPVVVVRGEPPQNPSLLCGFSWLACIFCCWPLGLVAIYFSNKYKNALWDGNMEAAKAAAKSATFWIVVTVICGLVIDITVNIALGATGYY